MKGFKLTKLELSILIPPPTDPPLSRPDQLRRFYLIWTLKEAYTKALGLGLGFDFSRIEYDVPNDVVQIDGLIPHGWEFTRFELQNQANAGHVEDYVGVVARFVGDGGTEYEKVRVAPSTPTWLTVYDAAKFLNVAIQELTP